MSEAMKSLEARRAPELAPAEAQAWTLANLDEIERVARACARSGFFREIRDASQAVVKMLAGREMGCGPIQALMGLYIVEGKLAAGASLIGGFVKRSGRYDYKPLERNEKRCILEWYENGEARGRSQFTLDDAKQAGLLGRANWQRYPRAMLFARALTEGVRVFCPDAAGGIVYTPEELRPEVTVNESGEVLTGLPTPEPEVEDEGPSEEEEAPNEEEAEPLTDAQASEAVRAAASRAKRFDAHGFELLNDLLRRGQLPTLPGGSRAADVRAHLREHVARQRYARFLACIREWEPPGYVPDGATDAEAAEAAEASGVF